VRQAEPVDNDWSLGGSISAGDQIYVRPIRNATPSAPDGALQTIFDVAIQGEGPGDDLKSHFRRFLDIYDKLTARASGAPAFTFPVACSPSVYPSRPGRTITHTIAKQWAELLNSRYEMLVLKIWFAMSQPKSPKNGPAGRKSLINVSVLLEMRSIAMIAKKLVVLPLKPRPADGSAPAEFAGPTFELPDAALPTAANQQRKRLKNLIALSAAQIQGLRDLIKVPPSPDHDVPTQQDDDYILKPLVADDAGLNPVL